MTTNPTLSAEAQLLLATLAKHSPVDFNGEITLARTKREAKSVRISSAYNELIAAHLLSIRYDAGCIRAKLA